MMTPERRKELDSSPDACLTDEELAEGYHFCCEWDYLMVGPNDGEADCCCCYGGKNFRDSKKEGE